MNKYKQARIIAAVGTILFHAGLLLLLLNVFLQKEVPQDEEGLEVMFGLSDDGGRDFFEPTPADEVAQAPVEETTPPEATAPSREEAYQTQDLEESVAMKKTKSEEQIKKEKELAEKRRIEKEKKLEEQRRIAEEKRKQAELQRRQDSIRDAIARKTSGLKGLGNSNGGSGTDAASNGTGGNSSGAKGNPFGSNTSKSTEGNTNTGGNRGYSLNGRSLKGNIVRPVYSEQVEGRIIVQITVDMDLIKIGNSRRSFVKSWAGVTEMKLR